MDFETTIPMNIAFNIKEFDEYIPSIKLEYMIEDRMTNHTVNILGSCWMKISVWRTFINELNSLSCNASLCSISEDFCIKIQHQKRIEFFLYATYENILHSKISTSYHSQIDKDDFFSLKNKFVDFFSTYIEIL